MSAVIASASEAISQMIPWDCRVARAPRNDISTVSVTGIFYEQVQIEFQVFGGVGTYDDASKTLNIAYGELKAGWFGLVFYKDAGAAMNGQWVVYGDTTGRLGTEILTKQ